MLSETALIKEVKKKNRKALEELHDRFAPVLLGLCLRYCGNRADAEDVLHDSFIKILSNLDTFREKPGSSFEGWMKRIAINTSLNFLRNRSRSHGWIELDPIQDQIAGEEEEELSLAGFAGILDKEDILRMICELPFGYRTVFNMYVFEDYSHKEIAEVLNCNENTSKTQLFKARAILKKRILEVLNNKVLNK